MLKEFEGMPTELEDRVGRLLVGDSFFKNASREQIRFVFGELVIVRAEHLYAQQAIEYTAYSELFDLVDKGEEIPEYRIRLKTSETGNSFEVQRVNRR